MASFLSGFMGPPSLFALAEVSFPPLQWKMYFFYGPKWIFSRSQTLSFWNEFLTANLSLSSNTSSSSTDLMVYHMVQMKYDICRSYRSKDPHHLGNTFTAVTRAVETYKNDKDLFRFIYRSIIYLVNPVQLWGTGLCPLFLEKQNLSGLFVNMSMIEKIESNKTDELPFPT